MNRAALLSLAALALLAPVLRTAAAPASPDTFADVFAIINVRVFDGTAVIPKAVVVVRKGKIEAVGPQVAVPQGAAVIDGAGGTLMPGFIDAHTHAFSESLRRALVFGVTTELDMFTDPGFARMMRAEQAAPGGAPGRADLFSAGSLATVPHGHGTEYGLPAPPITHPEEAQAWVDVRIAEGSDYIKIVDETGATFGMKIPTLDPPTIAALIRAAHKRGKLAVVHISSQASALRAIESGADGLVHLFADSPPDPDFARVVARRKAFIIPTLTVIQSTTASGMASGKGLVADPRLKAYLTQGEDANLLQSAPGRGELQYTFATVRQLRDAGVPILAGTDAPNPGTAHGVSIHARWSCWSRPASRRSRRSPPPPPCRPTPSISTTAAASPPGCGQTWCWWAAIRSRTSRRPAASSASGKGESRSSAPCWRPRPRRRRSRR
jgi:hypothetical protein